MLDVIALYISHLGMYIASCFRWLKKKKTWRKIW